MSICRLLAELSRSLTQRVRPGGMSEAKGLGISTTLNSKSVADSTRLENVPWDEVAEVAIYLQDCLVMDQLCLVFFVNGLTRSTLVICEDDAAFAKVALEIPVRLLGALTEQEWLGALSREPWVRVYRRPDRPQSIEHNGCGRA